MQLPTFQYFYISLGNENTLKYIASNFLYESYVEVQNRENSNKCTKQQQLMYNAKTNNKRTCLNAPGGHSTCFYEGILWQQLETRGLSVKDFPQKGGSSSEKTKKKKKKKSGCQTVRIRQIGHFFLGKIQIWTHLWQTFTKKNRTCWRNVVKRGIRWEIIENWLWIIKKKEGSLVGSNRKRGSVGESKLTNGVNVATHPRHLF